MERESFLKLLAERFYPTLRAEGFRGSGTTLRDITEPVVHVVNVQGSRSADGFYVNLGAHLSFLPTEGGSVCVPRKLKEYECAFRDRIDPPPGAPPHRWPYGRSPDEAESGITRLIDAWQLQGRAFFKRYSGFPDTFIELVRAAVASPPRPRDGLKYARIALALGLWSEAGSLARHALATAREEATGLRATLTMFIRELDAAQE
jgi:hypothetical protein